MVGVIVAGRAHGMTQPPSARVQTRQEKAWSQKAGTVDAWDVGLNHQLIPRCRVDRKRTERLDSPERRAPISNLLIGMGVKGRIMQTIEEIIADRLYWSYLLDKGLAAMAARDIVGDIQAFFNVEVKPYLDETPSRLFDVLAEMTRRDVEAKRLNK